MMTTTKMMKGNPLEEIEMSKVLKLALAQFAINEDKAENIKMAVCMIEDAAKLGSDMIILPVR